MQKRNDNFHHGSPCNEYQQPRKKNNAARRVGMQRPHAFLRLPWVTRPHPHTHSPPPSQASTLPLPTRNTPGCVLWSLVIQFQDPLNLTFCVLSLNSFFSLFWLVSSLQSCIEPVLKPPPRVWKVEKPYWGLPQSHLQFQESFTKPTKSHFIPYT